jgi:hypothetical protein
MINNPIPAANQTQDGIVLRFAAIPEAGTMPIVTVVCGGWPLGSGVPQG